MKQTEANKYILNLCEERGPIKRAHLTDQQHRFAILLVAQGKLHIEHSPGYASYYYNHNHNHKE